MSPLKHWINSGAPWVWLNAAAVSCCILLVLGLMYLIAVPGLGNFWPTEVQELDVINAEGERLTVAGQVRESEDIDAQRLRESGLSVPEDKETARRHLLKIGNRELSGQDFIWVPELQVE